nr:hypothetical protein [uncultured Rhodopila sp.]
MFGSDQFLENIAVNVSTNNVDIGVVLCWALLQVLQNPVNILAIPGSLNFTVMDAVILPGVLSDQQLRKPRQAAIAVAARRAGPPAAHQQTGLTPF